MITISIVEDNEQFRNGLEAIISSENDFFLAGSYSSAEKAIADLPVNAPDIVIADISLPGMKGTELIVRMKNILTQTQFMVCSIHDDNDTIYEALKCGASGYILKEPVTASEICIAIRNLYNGGSPMSPFIARKVISSFQKPALQAQNLLLSTREKEVLELLAKGLLYKEIAEKLGVTHETVKKHLKNIYQKLHVQNKIEALNKYKLL
ncbi:MAG: response regulator transcription factor [Ferruginibacter sp.]|nr:response regulator transcription factor [Bacteroidota bacterium]MBX2918491.1 response regulator transcription factor [Ferruginibacter sp.]